MPAVGIIVSAILSTILVLIQAAGTSGFQSFYSLVVGLSTMAAVIRMHSAPWRPASSQHMPQARSCRA